MIMPTFAMPRFQSKLHRLHFRPEYLRGGQSQYRQMTSSSSVIHHATSDASEHRDDDDIYENTGPSSRLFSPIVTTSEQGK